MRLTAALKWTALGSVLAAFGLWTLQVVRPLAVTGISGMHATAGFVFFFSLMALACSTTLEQGRVVALMWCGVVAAALSAAGWSVFAFVQPTMGTQAVQRYVQAMLPSSSFAVYCALAGLLLRYRLPNALCRELRNGTLVCAGILALIMAFLPFGDMPDSLIKAIGALAVLVAFGTIATMVIARLPRIDGAAEGADEVRLDFTATCPRCTLRQRMVTGGHACSRCGLRITVRVP